MIISVQKGAFPDLLATSGDYLRVWQTGDSGTRLECLLNNVSMSGGAIRSSPRRRRRRLEQELRLLCSIDLLRLE